MGSLGYVCQYEWQCLAGHACSDANSPMTLCPVGKYSLTGANVCVACPGGLYGDTVGMPNATCSGQCRQVSPPYQGARTTRHPPVPFFLPR